MLSVASQSYGSDDDSDGDDDEAGHTMDSAQEDEELLEAATELLTALAHTLDPGVFTPLFEQKLLQALLLWTRPNQPDGMRAQAMGAAAEVCEALGPSAAPVVGTVMPVVLNELRSEVRSAWWWARLERGIVPWQEVSTTMPCSLRA